MYTNPAIIWTSPNQDVFVVDIPTTICIAQFPSGTDVDVQVSLTSCEPQTTPWNATEPRSVKARQNVISRIDPSELDRANKYAEYVRLNLPEVQAALSSKKWCLHRLVAEPSDPPRRQEEEAAGHSSFARNGRQAINLEELEQCESVHSVDEARDCFMYNSSSNALRFAHANSPISYMIPPKSSFLQGFIDQSSAADWSRVVMKQLPATSSAWQGQFDLIVLDPPWDNKSVKRKRNYKTAYASEDDPMDVLTAMLLPHIALEAVVACWVTNNAKTRDQALRAFATWDVELVEEWIWLKVTDDGQSVYDLDGLWRKPYEIVLIGRKAPIDNLQNRPEHCPPLKLLIAVPDLHSRKPCLRDLLNPMCSAEYRGLEIFARHLVSGWSSWGNEVLKFNGSDHMRQSESAKT